MTLEEIINKIDGLNAKLDDYILGIQFMPSKFDSKDLEEGAKSIERIILDDPSVKAVLADRNNEQRQQYLDAIKQGVEKAKDTLEKFRQAERDVNIKKAVVDIKKNAYKGVENVVSGIEELEKPDSKVALTDDFRKKDLLEKIEKAEKAMDTAERFDKIRPELKAAGKKGYVTEAIEEVEEVKEFIEQCEANINKINNMCKTPEGNKKPNFIDKVEEYKKLRNDGKTIDSPEVQKMLNEMKEMAEFIDTIDGEDANDKKILNLTGLMPTSAEDFKDETRVNEWIKDIEENKYKDTDLIEKMKLDDRFVKSRIDIINKQAEDKMKKSIVLKHMGYNDRNNIITDVKKFLDNVLYSLNAYNDVRGKDSADLKRMIADAKKLYESYEISTSNHNEVTINGKTKELTGEGVDMTDKDKADKALSVIKSLDAEDEFKKEFEAKVDEEVERAMLAHPQPQYGRFKGFLYGLRKIVTFGLVKTPKEKYEQLYFSTKNEKEVKVTEDIIEKNANKISQAKEQVQYDKDLYYKAATQQIISKKQKLNEKAKNTIIKNREKNDPLTR